MVRRVVGLFLACLLAFGASVVSSGKSYADLPSVAEWTTRLSGTQNYLAAIAYGNGHFVAVGHSGVITTSEDAVKWAVADSGTNHDLNAVTYGNGKFVVVGEHGTILASKDGVHWSTSALPNTGLPYLLLSGVIFADSHFIAVDASGATFSSTDALTWHYSAGLYGSNYTAIVYSNGLFLAAGLNTIDASSDGSHWNQTFRPDKGKIADWRAVAYGNGTFVSAGRIFSIHDTSLYDSNLLLSADGLNWTKQAVQLPDSSGPLDVQSLLFTNGKFLLANGTVGQQKLFTSSDAVNWAPFPAPPKTISSIAAGSNLLVAVGVAGTIYTIPATAIGSTLSGDGNEDHQTNQDTGGGTSGGGGGSSTPTDQGSGQQGQSGSDSSSVGTTPDADTGTPPLDTAIGNLHIQADHAEKVNGIEEYSGIISLSDYLKLDGTLKVDRANSKVDGDGRLFLITDANTGALDLYEGGFSLDADAAQLLQLTGRDQLKLAGLDVKLDKLKLIEGGVDVAATLTLPDLLGGASVKLEQFQIVRGKISTDVTITLPKISLGEEALGLEDASLHYVSEKNEFEGKATLEIPKLFGVMGTLGVRSARLSKVGVGLDGLKLAIDASGLFVEKIYGEVSGLDDPPISLTATTSITGGPEILGIAAIKGEDLSLTVDLKRGSLSGSGKLKVVNYDLLEASFSISHQDGFSATAELNALDFIKAKASLQIRPDYFMGHAEGEVRIPDEVWFIGGKTLGKAGLTIDTIGIHASIDEPMTAFCVLNWQGHFECHFGEEKLSEASYRVPLFASASLTALPPTPGFDLPEGLHAAIVRLTWDQGDTDFTLTRPDGTVISPGDAGAAATSPVLYWKNQNHREALYLLREPAAGAWHYGVTSPSSTAIYHLDVYSVAQPASWHFQTPTGSQSVSGPFAIKWQATAHSGSTVSLFYDRTGEGYHGTPIAMNLDTGSGTFTWDPSSLPSGVYHIYGILSDGDARIPIYAPGSLTINNSKTPEIPSGLTARAANGRLILSWTANSEPDLDGYTLSLSDEPDRTLTVGRDQTTAIWAGLEPGKTYHVAISAFSQEGLESAMSAPVEIALPKPQPPKIIVVWPDARLTNQKSLQILATASGDATLQLFRDDIAVYGPQANGMSTFVTLSPGPNLVRLVARAANGDTSEATETFIYDGTPPMLIVDDFKESATVSSAVLSIKGTTEPTSNLKLSGAAIPVNADGKFTTTINLAPGPNSIVLVATDRAGNRTTFHATVTYQPCGTMFPDVMASNLACNAIERLGALDVLSGYPDGNFHPESGVTRAEFARMLVAALGQPPVPGGKLPFHDVDGHWAASKGFLQAAVGLNVIQGFPDGTFRPDEPVTRAQLSKIAAAAKGLTPSGEPIYIDISPQDWYAGWVAAAYKAGLIGWPAPHPVWTDIEFLGNQPATRADAALVLANLIERRKQ